MPTAAILQYLSIGYAHCFSGNENDVFVTFRLATYSPNKLRQISKLFKYRLALSKNGGHLLPQKCMMMSFVIVEGGGGDIKSAMHSLLRLALQ